MAVWGHKIVFLINKLCSVEYGMKSAKKTKAQLLKELETLHRRVADLQAREAACLQAELRRENR